MDTGQPIEIAEETTKVPNDFVHEQVYSRLKAGLMSGELIPGRSLSVRRLAAEFDVSAMPAREAIRRLVALGALEMSPTRRVMVANMTNSRLAEIKAARLALEPMLAGMAVERLTGRERARLARKLEAIDQDLDETIKAGDVTGYARLNREFHFTLYGASESEVVIGLVESLWLQFGPYMRQVIGRLGTSCLIDDQHKTIIEAMKAGDKDRVIEAVTEDIGQGLDTIDMDQTDSEK